MVTHTKGDNTTTTPADKDNPVTQYPDQLEELTMTKWRRVTDVLSGRAFGGMCKALGIQSFITTFARKIVLKLVPRIKVKIHGQAG